MKILSEELRQLTQSALSRYSKDDMEYALIQGYSRNLQYLVDEEEEFERGEKCLIVGSDWISSFDMINEFGKTIYKDEVVKIIYVDGRCSEPIITFLYYGMSIQMYKTQFLKSFKIEVNENE